MQVRTPASVPKKELAKAQLVPVPIAPIRKVLSLIVNFFNFVPSVNDWDEKV